MRNFLECVCWAGNSRSGWTDAQVNLLPRREQEADFWVGEGWGRARGLCVV